MSDVRFFTCGSSGTQLPGVIIRRPLPIFDTAIGSAKTGAEYRVSEAATRYRYHVQCKLRSWLNEDQSFVDFFIARGGRRDSFLVTGPDAIERRVRFDADDLDNFEWNGPVLVGTIDLITVIGPEVANPQPDVSELDMELEGELAP